MLTLLQKLSPRKAAGIDKISSQLLRIAAPVIAPVVARLINFSFSSGSFPSRWKTAKVSPLYKNGDSRDVQNFRPISVLPVLSKVIERHVHDSLYSYLTENNLIYPRQSGFRKNHSTDTALIQIIDELLLNLDKNRVSGMVLVDYSKAFDMVDHGLLLDKLKVYMVLLAKQWSVSSLIWRTDTSLSIWVVASQTWRLWNMGFLRAVYSAPCFSQFLLMTCHFMSAPLKSIFMQTILQSHRQQIVAAWEDCRNLLIHLYQKFLTGHWPTGFHSTKKDQGPHREGKATLDQNKQ